MAAFKCETLTSSLLWIYESTVHQIFYTKDSTLNVPQCLGPFVVVQLNSIVTSADGNQRYLELNSYCQCVFNQ